MKRMKTAINFQARTWRDPVLNFPNVRQAFRCAELLSTVNSCYSKTSAEHDDSWEVTQLPIPTYFHLSFTFIIHKGHCNMFYVSAYTIYVTVILEKNVVACKLTSLRWHFELSYTNLVCAVVEKLLLCTDPLNAVSAHYIYHVFFCIKITTFR